MAPWEWGLAESAAEATAALRISHALPADAVWVGSPEPKAVATARLLTAEPLRVDPDLREAGRDAGYVSATEFAERVRRSFEDVDRAAATGWEPLALTRQRVHAAARRAVDDAAGRDVVLVGHGTAFTMLVAALVRAAPDVESWQTMRFPDHCALAVDPLGSARIMSPWGAWTT